MKRSFIYFISLSIIVSLLFNVCNAQVDSACFDAVDTIGCVPFTVKIKNCSNGTGIQYWYGEGTDTFGVDLISDTFYVYKTPGIYTIMQSVNIGGDQQFLFKENYIEVLCCMNLQVTAQNNLNNITWTNYKEDSVITNYLIRNNDTLQIYYAPALPTSYVDSNVRCGIEYCYQLISELTSEPEPIKSCKQCVTAFSSDTPQVVKNFNTTIFENLPTLTWDIPNKYTVQQYIISKLEKNSDTVVIGTSSQNNFIDAAANTSEDKNCYIVTYVDSCGNQANSTLVSCPVLLKGKKTDKDTYQLNWTPYVGWQNGVKQYCLEWLDDFNNPYDSIMLTDTVYTDNRIEPVYSFLRYRVKVISTIADSAISYSNIVALKQDIRLFIPNAFTPDNGDDLNDTFRAKGLFIKDFKMIIYNRWGEIIFVSNQMSKGWDGTINGKQAPVGVYAYLIEAKDFGGEQYTRSGTVTLLR